MNDSEPQNPPTVDELLRSTKPLLSRVLARYHIPPQDAEDLLQNTVLQFLKKRSEIRKPPQWLAGALANECRGYWRQRDRRREDPVDQALIELTADRSSDSQEELALRERLQEAIDTLDHRCRTVLTLRYSLGYNDAEIAEETGYRPSSVDKTVRRCVTLLKKRLLLSPRTGRT